MANRIAVIETNKGTIRFELLEEDAPKTTENFRLLAGKDYFNDVIFHRVIKNFMIHLKTDFSNKTALFTA